MSELSNPKISKDILNYFKTQNGYCESLTIHELKDLVEKPKNINQVIFQGTLDELIKHGYLIAKEISFLKEQYSGIGFTAGCPTPYFITEKGKTYLEEESLKRFNNRINEVTTEPIIAPVKIQTKEVGIFKIISEHPIISGIISTLISTFIIWLIYSFLKSNHYWVFGIPVE